MALYYEPDGAVNSRDGSGSLKQTPSSKTALTPRTALLASGKRVVWKDVYAEVPVQTNSQLAFWKKSENNRVVLDQVSGVAEAGELTFIMGASGAGKTTLLNILTQRNLRGVRVYGEVLINKRCLEPGDIRKISAYVQQEDDFIGELSVRETIILAAKLRMSCKFEMHEKMRRVEDVIRSMGLTNCKDTRIGSKYQKSISRGEKKRLAFACEILNDPSILFCDEPTSGLDSFMAEQVISVMKKFALDGKTVISTIHQPSSQVYELADRLCLMANGRVAYQGNADEVTAFMKSAGFPLSGKFMNPSDHFMKIMSRAEHEQEDEHTARVNKIINHFTNSHYGDQVHWITHFNTPSNTSKRRLKEDYSLIKQYQTGWFTQTFLLMIRAFKCVLRNPMILQVRLFQVTLCAIIIGCIFMQTELHHETISNYVGVHYNAVRDMNFMFVFPCISVFTNDLSVVMREYKGGMYHPSAYYIGKNLADTVQYLIFPVVYSSIVFFMSFPMGNLHLVSTIQNAGTVKFLKFTLANMLMATTATSMGYAAACIFGSLEIASQFLPLVVVPLFVFGGLFINLNSVPIYFRWLKYISYYRYSFEAHMNNMFEDMPRIKGCHLEERKDYCHSHHNSTEQGMQLMDFMDMRRGFYWYDILLLVVIAVFLRAIGVVALQLRTSLR